MRILVIGGDAFLDPRAVFVRLDDLCIEARKSGETQFVLIYPDGSKAGEIADCWARKRGVTPNKWPAIPWPRHHEILDDGAPDLVVCYPGYPRWLVRKAVKRGIRCVEAT